MGRTKWRSVLWGLATFLASAWAWAEPATLTLTSGESAVVDIVHLEEGKEVRVRLSDGSEKTIPWEWVAKLEKHEPAADPASTLPDTTEPIPEPDAVTPPPPPPSGPANQEKIAALDQDIARTQEQMPSLTAPKILTYVGFGVGGAALIGAAVGSSRCPEVSDYEGCKSTMLPIFIVGGVGVAAGVGGLIWLMSRKNSREHDEQKIERLEEERDRLKADVSFGPDGGMGSLTWSF